MCHSSSRMASTRKSRSLSSGEQNPRTSSVPACVSPGSDRPGDPETVLAISLRRGRRSSSLGLRSRGEPYGGRPRASRPPARRSRSDRAHLLEDRGPVRQGLAGAGRGALFGTYLARHSSCWLEHGHISEDIAPRPMSLGTWACCKRQDPCWRWHGGWRDMHVPEAHPHVPQAQGGPGPPRLQ